MDVGILLVAQNWYKDKSDERVFMDEVEMGVAAEEAGFESVWSAEHHFDDYSIHPDNFQVLSYIHTRPKRVKLGTAPPILPSDEPLRTAEHPSQPQPTHTSEPI